MPALILNTNHALIYRISHTILPLLLATSIIFIFVTFSRTAFSLLSEDGGFALSKLDIAWTVFAWIAVAVMGYKTLHSLGHASCVDPGAVSPHVQRLYRGIAVEFNQRQHQWDYPGQSVVSMVGEEGALSNIGEVEVNAAVSASAGEHEGSAFTAVQDGSVAVRINNDENTAIFSAVPCATGMPEAIFTRPGPHDPRWCRYCRVVKPPRTHHCSTCDRCVTKMDHRALAGCVG